ncbi:general secretion pathway protein GspB [Vogesella facilis]|uniref:General secretion pathway protein GspB n=1 Tax=Vogesella facilis TaxID=1655232 RepID=A0ABV7R9B5_9NEIS
MSYILDALLKAEQERQRAAAPTLQSVYSQPAESRALRRQRPRPALLALGALLCAAGLAAVWWPRPAVTPASSAKVAEVPPPAAAVAAHPPVTLAAQAAAPAAPPTAIADEQAAPVPPPAPEATPRRAIAAPPATTTTSTSARREPERQAKAAPLPAAPPASKVPPKTATAAAEGVTANGDRVLDISELPPALRQEVDKSVVVSGLSLSPDNGEQLAIINDRARRTGDDIIAGMTLERIQADGVVLRYKGYRFRRGLY